MAELKNLADQTAKDLLKAIGSRTAKADDAELVNLAQAYSLVVSAEVTFDLVIDDELQPQAQNDSP
jgi:hypothetical protein